MSCLLIKNDGLGDLILSSGIVDQLSIYFNGNLDLVTCEQNSEIVEHLNGVNRAFYVSRDGITYKETFEKIGIKSASGQDIDRKTLKHLKRNHYDYAICLRRYIRKSSLVLMDHVNAKNKFCCWKYPTNASYEYADKISRKWHHIKESDYIFNEADYYKAFLKRALNIEVDNTPKLNIVFRRKTGGKKIIGLGIGGLSSQWPLAHWLRLIEMLQKDGWMIELYGGKNVEDNAMYILDYYKNITYVTELPFKEIALRFSRLTAFIGNDTGLSHFASLFIEKCLIVYGGGTFKKFFPWPNPQNQYVIYHGLNCFDCEWRCKYKERLCLGLISPNEIYSYFNKIGSEKNVPHVLNLNKKSTNYQLSWFRQKKDEAPVILDFDSYKYAT